VVASMVTADVESGHTEYAGGADYFGKGAGQPAG
jgi:3-oxoacyl-[acyl-carrier protein] reductase